MINLLITLAGVVLTLNPALLAKIAGLGLFTFGFSAAIRLPAAG